MNAGRIKRKAKSLMKYFKREYLKICENGSKSSNSDFFADNYHTVFEACEYCAHIEKEAVFSEKLGPAKNVARKCGNKFMPTDELLEVLSASNATPKEIEFLKAELSLYLLLELKTALLKGFECQKPISLLADISGIDQSKIIKTLSVVDFWLSHRQSYKDSSDETKRRIRLMVFAKKQNAEDYAKTLSLLSEDEFIKAVFQKSQKVPRKAVFLCYSFLLFAVSVLICIWLGLAVFDMWALVLVLPVFGALRSVFDSLLQRLLPNPELPKLSSNSFKVQSERCLIVLSAAVGDASNAEALQERLLKLHLANPQTNISVVALIDLSAESAPFASEDKAVLKTLQRVIEQLNSEYPKKFCCVVRRRSYSKTQEEFMGAERKRGAILDFCRFLATGKEDFLAVSGDAHALVGTRYICAVDFDTEPEMDAVTELLATALHPFNTPEIVDGKVKKGYGIFVPKLVVGLENSLENGFTKAMGGIGSASSYDTAERDFWFLTSGNANFCGKGLIFVEALLRTCSNLPPERILSHDILEGELCKTAFCGDTMFTEGFPKTFESYFKRLDRWVRGDFQNLIFLFSRRFGMVSKLKLLGNARRALTPFFVLLTFFASFWVYSEAANPLALVAILCYALPPILGIIKTVATAIFKQSGFTSAQEYWYKDLAYLAYSVVLLPSLALKQLKAAFTAIFRLISGKRLLEWTTSRSADAERRDPISFWFFAELAGIALLFSPSNTVKLFALTFISLPLLIILGELPTRSKTDALTYRQKRELSSQIASMWQFYADYVTETESFLPPDNVQQAPVYKICHRTSPTNIGLYMLSCLVACDRRLISVENLQKRLDFTLNSVEKLKKYKGNLYNWYNTQDLTLCHNPYVSSVDSGNFVCCLVTLCEGLKEYLPQQQELRRTIERLQRIINSTDLSVFYNPAKGLMSVGINPETKKADGYYYDCLISEARLTSYYAIATRQVPKKHWKRLSRRELSYGFISGTASYSGTMFEYFMPYIFTPAPEGSLIRSAQSYALQVQQRYAKRLGKPFGVSEGGYYAFDADMCYLYKAHGVPKTGLRQGLEKGLVVSPYSTYLALEFCIKSGFDNIEKLKDLGLWGGYGLYEAVDFNGKTPKIVKSHMAHHLGMSILAAHNLLEDGKIRKRFMKNKYMAGASELLNERPTLGRRVFENAIIKPKTKKEEEIPQKPECFSEISPFAPKFKLLSGGEYSLAICDSGVGISHYRGKAVLSKTKDLILNPQGLEIGVAVDGNGKKFEPSVAEFGIGYARFESEFDGIFTNIKAQVHKTLPCEIRRISVENKSKITKNAEIMAFCEPILCESEAFEAHPAFEKMRIGIEYEQGVAIAKRISKQGYPECFLAVGFLEEEEIFCSFDRESVKRHGFKGYKAIERSFVAEPDPCIFVKTKLNLAPREKREITLFLVCSQTKEELLNAVATLKTKTFSEVTPHPTPGLRLSERLLPLVLLQGEMTDAQKEALIKNELPINSLWELGVPTDKPMILVHLTGKNDQNKLTAYLSAYRHITLSGVSATLAFTLTDGGNYSRPQYKMLVDTAHNLGLDGLIYSKIMPIEITNISASLANLLEAYACHISNDSLIFESCKPQKSLITPISSKGVKQAVETSCQNGGFYGNKYIINTQPKLPWSHLLSNSQFGTLLSHNSLGFSYAFNSRQNRLTPWQNDTARGNRGERLLLKSNGKIYDLIQGAVAVFEPYKATYHFMGEGYKGTAKVSVSKKGMCKKIEVDIEANGELCYYTEPCLGVDRQNCRFILPEKQGNTVIISSKASECFGYMGLSCDKASTFTTCKNSFWQGDWQENLLPDSSPILAVVTAVKGSQTLCFSLSYGLSKKSALAMPNLFDKQESTKENELTVLEAPPHLAPFVNEWARYQALHARIWARTGFYQSSGAFGFRDQLQDALCIILENPLICKKQILRCCRVQFSEGDVLHWWHTLPGKLPKGIRTKISDDALWLVFAVCEYVEKTGDLGILSIKVPFCQGLELENKEEAYGEVRQTSERASVLEHCIRAVELRKDKVGAHGLLLIGAGDWNDGFSAVGKNGFGESVWLTEFYIWILKRFSKLCCDMQGYSNELLARARAFETAIELSGKENDRYLRAYFDSGEVLGSKESKYCKIDSISQSFSVFAEIGSREFNRQALLSAIDNLADFKHGVIKLFTPPFENNAEPNPGYIASYPKGLRENGGQYTHAAVWLGMACIKAGLSVQGLNILNAINPATKNEHYKTEPYYLCGDVYANPNCYGRGGWSIYTGSAAWYYKAITEDILGIRLVNGKIEIKGPLLRSKIEYKKTPTD